jgi:hypothetical protein
MARVATSCLHTWLRDLCACNKVHVRVCHNARARNLASWLRAYVTVAYARIGVYVCLGVHVSKIQSVCMCVCVVVVVVVECADRSVESRLDHVLDLYFVPPDGLLSLEPPCASCLFV